MDACGVQHATTATTYSSMPRHAECSNAATTTAYSSMPIHAECSNATTTTAYSSMPRHAECSNATTTTTTITQYMFGVCWWRCGLVAGCLGGRNVTHKTVFAPSSVMAKWCHSFEAIASVYALAPFEPCSDRFGVSMPLFTIHGILPSFVRKGTHGCHSCTRTSKGLCLGQVW